MLRGIIGKRTTVGGYDVCERLEELEKNLRRRTVAFREDWIFSSQLAKLDHCVSLIKVHSFAVVTEKLLQVLLRIITNGFHNVWVEQVEQEIALISTHCNNFRLSTVLACEAWLTSVRLECGEVFVFVFRKTLVNDG